MTTRATPRLVATRYHRLEEYDHLIRFGIPLGEIAKQLGIKPESLKRSLLRRRRRVDAMATSCCVAEHGWRAIGQASAR